MKRVLFLFLALSLLLGVTTTAAQDAPTPDPSLAGALQVAQVLPADGSQGVASDALIVVIFNRPVVPLLISEETGNLPNPLTFDPAITGSGEWVNTSIYQFRAEPGLAGGQTYRVTVDGSLTAVDGATMSGPFTWSFSTAVPTITSVIPADMSVAIRLEQTIQMTFSAPLDRTNAEAAFQLHPLEQGSGHIEGTFEWADDSTGFRFTPAAPLQIGTVYSVGFMPGQVTAPGGGAPMQDPMTSFATVGPPGILSTDPYDGQQDAYPYSGFTIYFQSPMNPDTLRDRVTIQPEIAGEYDTYYNDYNDSYTLAFNSEPSTDYTVTIEAGAEDIYGNVLQQPMVVQFHTRPFDPDVMLQVPGSVGFYNANNPVTQLFLTHRNVSRVDLELYRVDTSEFLRLATGENAYDPAGNFQPTPASLLRSWSIPSDTPENQRQYELLNLSEVTNGPVTCAGAPEARLQIGDTARVITDAVRVRAVPVDGEVLTVLYQNAVLPITGGPTCAANYLWWQVTLPDGRTGWAAEGTTDEYYLDVESQVAQTPVDVTDADGGALAPGVYFLSVSTPETANLGWQPNGHFLVVGNTNVTTKTSPDQVLTWLTDVETGEPLADVSFSVYMESLQDVGSARTDADGIARLPTPRGNDLYSPRAVLVQDGTHFGIGLSTWSDGIDGYNFNLPTNYSPAPYLVYLYTDRPVYRPNQPVYFRGVAREQNDIQFTPPSLRSIPVQIMDEMGNVVYQQDVPLTPFGTFTDTFVIASDAPLGFYRIAVLMPGEDPTYYGRSGWVGFNVAEYRAPEFQVTVTPDQDQVAQGDTIRVGVDARYFFGGIVQNATIDYSIVAQPFYFYLPNGSYNFGDYDFDAGSSNGAGRSGEIATGQALMPITD
ncbi:MAG: Ig-like domain-containing protein [Anaerolineae bacterium]